MKKIGLVVLSLLVVSMFLVGCTQENSDVSDTQIESELSQLSDQELEDVVKQTQVEENKNLAGQAYRAYRKTFSIRGKSFPTRKTSLVASKLLRQRQQLKIAQLNKTVIKLNQTLVNITNVTKPVNVTNQTWSNYTNQTGVGNFTNQTMPGNYTNQTGNYTYNQTGNYTNNQTNSSY